MVYFREGPYGLVSQMTIPLNINIEDTDVLCKLSSSIFYLLRKGSSFIKHSPICSQPQSIIIVS